MDPNSVMGAITCWVHPHPLKEEEGIVGDDGVSKIEKKWKNIRYYNLIIKNHKLKLFKRHWSSAFSQCSKKQLNLTN